MSIKLKTEAGVLEFIVKNIKAKDSFFDFDIVSIWYDKYSGYLPADFFCSLNFDDINRLVEYFYRHKLSVLTNQVNESLVYMPLGSDFQIRFMAGEAESMEDGYFSIGFLFNLGSSCEESSNVYFGFEAGIDFLAADDFCVSLKELVTVEQ
ncbi:hypothetical protein [Pseudomonas protegens]|uniref:hypothetical protein n=1 Tax=Pseudomonas protegens TaxID=380021 RepID=UPI000CD1721B|nr:hypothetical protein [Pseudomonas protegens]POA84332.1 hypothetical protein C1883_24240 [Pseudomonas protegens]